MLYDPKWEVQTKPDVFSLENLIAWLEKQPTTAVYNYVDCGGRCLFGQYMAAHGFPWKMVIGMNILDTGGDDGFRFKQFVYDRIATQKPWTFGAALERARHVASRQ